MTQTIFYYLCIMFVRRKKNRSGTTTVVVVSKRNGDFVEVKNFGTVSTDEEIATLSSKARHWLNTNGNQQSLDFEDIKGRERDETKRVVDNMDAVLMRNPT